MPRAKRGNKRLERRKKILKLAKGYRGTKSKLYRSAKESVERGLNFASEWDVRYQSVLESHDPGEKELFGGELYTRYGKGAYIFTSYDWFRELPAGVPGAYRLFANMLSAAKVQ